jgi:predicted nucleic acid-binding protein
VLFDTDVLIWLLRGNEKAARWVEENEDRCLSVITYMELLQGARGGKEVRIIKDFLSDFAFRRLPLTENIGHRASIYMEEYGLESGMCVADALLAATAMENHQVLGTGNQKHYKVIKDLETKIFRPG